MDTDSSINSLLVYIQLGNMENVKKILEFRADYPSNELENFVNSTSSIDGFSPLQYAVSKSWPDCNYKVIELLLKYKANVNATNSITGFSILHSAISNCVGKEVIELLISYGANVNKQNSKDSHCTPLLYALRKECSVLDFEVIELLLKRGADIHTRDFKNGPNTALLYAVQHPGISYKLIELLLKYKPNVSVVSLKDGFSVLQHAIRNPNSNPKIIELLLVSGANVHAKNGKDGNCTALLYAIRKNTLIYEEIELLLRFQSDPNAENYNSGLSVLKYAVSHSNVNYKVVELLLKYNAEVFNCNIYGLTPIMSYVIRNRNIDPKVLDLMCTRTKYKMEFDDLVDSRTNFEAVKLLVRRETDNTRINVFKICLKVWYLPELNQKVKRVCFEILKWLVLQHFKKDPKSIKDRHTVKSVLEARFFKFISGHEFRDGFFFYVNKCIVDIVSMKLDGLSVLLFPEMLAEEPSPIDTRIVANRLLNIWSKENPSIYLDIIESNVESKDLLSFLLEFQISTRLTFEGAEKILFLGYLPTLRIVEYLPLTDMLSLVQAFYGFFKNLSTSEKLQDKTWSPRVKLARVCKKQKLN